MTKEELKNQIWQLLKEFEISCVYCFRSSDSSGAWIKIYHDKQTNLNYHIPSITFNIETISND